MSDSDFDPQNFKDELLQTTLTAVRRRRRGRMITKLCGSLALVAVIGIVLLRSIDPVVPQRVVESEATSEEESTERLATAVEIVTVRTQPISEQQIVRTDAVAAESYLVRTPASPSGVEKASDDKLLAALEGQGVILVTDRSGQTDLRVLD